MVRTVVVLVICFRDMAVLIRKFPCELEVSCTVCAHSYRSLEVHFATFTRLQDFMKFYLLRFFANTLMLHTSTGLLRTVELISVAFGLFAPSLA